MEQLEIKQGLDEMIVSSEELDTEIWIDNGYDVASLRLSWVEAQQLYRWLKERLSE